MCSNDGICLTRQNWRNYCTQHPGWTSQAHDWTTTTTKARSRVARCQFYPHRTYKQAILREARYQQSTQCLCISVGGAKELEEYTEMPRFFLCRLVQLMQTLKTLLYTKEERNWAKHLVLTSDLCTHVRTHVPTHMCNINTYTNKK